MRKASWSSGSLAVARRGLRLVLAAILIALSGWTVMAADERAAPARQDGSSGGEAIHPPATKIGSGDLVEIRIVGDDSVSAALSGQFRVNDDGTIDYPVLGSLQAAGMSTQGLGEKIHAAISAQVPLGGQPFVRIVEFAAVFLVGDVSRPGAYPYRPGLTVMDLLLSTGGFREAPDRTQQIAALRSELSDLGILDGALEARRRRLIAEANDLPIEKNPSAPSAPGGAVLAVEEQFFLERQRAARSRKETFEAQRRTNKQEIESLTATLRLHEESLAILREQMASQAQLADRGLVPKSRLMEMKRELIEMQRQALDYQTALFRAQQSGLELDRNLSESQMGVHLEALQALAETETAIARNDVKRGLTARALARLEAAGNPDLDDLIKTATYAIFRRGDAAYTSFVVPPTERVARGDIVRIEFADTGETASPGPGG